MRRMRVAAIALVLVMACGAPGGQTAPPAPTTARATSPPTPTTPSTPPTTVPSPSLQPAAAIAPLTELRSTAARISAGSDRLAGVPALTRGDADVAFRLYHELTAAEPGSLFFSPYSIITAL